MTRTVALSEFMPYGAPELQSVARPYMVRALLRVPDPIPDHAADALAAAYCLSKKIRETQYRTAPSQYRRSAPRGKRSNERSDPAIAVARRTGRRR